MKVLFITAHKYLPQMLGGLQTSTDEFCHSLMKRGHQVSVLAGLMPKDDLFTRMARLQMKIRQILTGHQAAKNTVMGYPVWLGWHPEQNVGYVAAKEKPDVIVVMAIEPVKMAMSALHAGVPLVMQLMDVEFAKHGGDFAALGKVACMANSRFTAEKYKKAYGVDSVVIYPFIDPKKYETQTSRENVTFINPVAEKGRSIALELAKRCPEIPFTFVEGWPLAPDDRKQLEGALSTLPNVTMLPPQKDMRAVYGKCKILLAPSMWEEAYGRIAAEAALSGIPAVASNRGGLPEAVGPGGILLDPDGPIEPWMEALRKLWNDKAAYAELSEAARIFSHRGEMGYDALCTAMERSLAEAARTKASA